ncbi:MAG TPA: serine protease [Solirubrobacteraceae bacterium]|jgi:secreted trypsin-like serine protease|nr:serine protease [Solirubrobacteraceae bacterium]
MRCLLVSLLAAVLTFPATASAVVGGQDATRPYPYMVAFEYDDAPSPSTYYQVCGASLIGADKVLTAAHCVYDDRDGDFSSEVVPPSSVRILVGTQDLGNRTGAETIGASKIEVFPEYDSDFKGDVAIVTLQRAATRGAPLRLANPATEKPLWAAGKQAIVTGWGTSIFMDPGLAYQDQLQEVQLPMVSDADCDLAYFTDDPIHGDFYADVDVCAGERTGMKDSCQGDSGGPLVVPDATGALVQVGVVSRGFGCGYPNSYGVYARVADTKLWSWIDARAPQTAAPAATTSTGGSTGGDAGGTGTASEPERTGDAGATSQTTGSTSGTRGSTAFQACMRRADRVRGHTARRRAVRRCQLAEQRRAAYRRCTQRAAKLGSRSRRARAVQRCRAQRRAAARRHARLVRAMR